MLRTRHMPESPTPMATLPVFASRRLLRVRSGAASCRTPTEDTRIYLKSLRAAQMAAWEATGGDVLLSTAENRPA